MNKKDLQDAVIASYVSSVRAYYINTQDVKMSTFWCLDKYDMDYFIDLLEEKIPEDFSFLKNKNFEVVQDVCAEIENIFPVETPEIASPTVKSHFHSKSAATTGRNRQKD